MGISDVYLSIGQRRNISHLANIVRIAKSDNEVSEEEIALLTKISHRYAISEDQFWNIMEKPESVPTLAHLECEERIERLYELLQMVLADQHIRKREVVMLRRIVTGLAFPLNKVDAIVDWTLGIDPDKMDIDRFKKELQAYLKELEG